MNVMQHLTAHFQADEAEIVADETTGFVSKIDMSTDGAGCNYWVLFVRGVAHNVWTHGLTGQVVYSFPVAAGRLPSSSGSWTAPSCPRGARLRP